MILKTTYLFLLLILSLSALPPAQAAPPSLESCSEPSGPILADNSTSKKYFTDLLARASSAPLEDFLRFWYPGKSNSAEGEQNSLLCKEEEQKGIQAVNASAPPILQPKCLVDTVYSWGPREKLLALQRSLPDNAAWRNSPNPGHALDTALSAVGSYGYGQVPVRIKLKPGNFGNPLEFIVDDGQQIASWSFGTPEHYDEIVRDYLRFASHRPWQGYWATSYLDGPGDKLFLSQSLDDHPFTRDALKASLIEMIRMILNGDGRIYYSAGECRNRQLAFETRFPTYINPFSEPAQKPSGNRKVPLEAAHPSPDTGSGTSAK